MPNGFFFTAAMRRVNPKFIPRNHLVEAALDAASLRQDFQPFEDLLAVVSRPYDERPELEKYSTPAPRNVSCKRFAGRKVLDSVVYLG
jgi:uncharacterized protein YdiU (UPF0061 family)